MLFSFWHFTELGARNRGSVKVAPWLSSLVQHQGNRTEKRWPPIAPTSIHLRGVISGLYRQGKFYAGRREVPQDQGTPGPLQGCHCCGRAQPRAHRLAQAAAAAAAAAAAPKTRRWIPAGPEVPGEGGRKNLASPRRRRAHAPSLAGAGAGVATRKPEPGRARGGEGGAARGREQRRQPPLAAGLFIPGKKFRSGRQGRKAGRGGGMRLGGGGRHRDSPPSPPPPRPPQPPPQRERSRCRDCPPPPRTPG